jgi:hypothetical protein
MNAVQIATAAITVVNFILIIRALYDNYKTRKLLERVFELRAAQALRDGVLHPHAGESFEEYSERVARAALGPHQ